MKIVVPIMPTSLEEAQALELSRFEGADIIEWRADFLDKHSILTVAPAIFEKFAGFEIVFTIRTTREGGKIELTDGEYVTLIKDVAAIYSPDYIDFEYFTRKEVFDQMLGFSNLVLSYHNFEETPENLMELFTASDSQASSSAGTVISSLSDFQVKEMEHGFYRLSLENTSGVSTQFLLHSTAVSSGSGKKEDLQVTEYITKRY